MPEVRTAVMIVVEACWQDRGGVWQTVSGRIEDKSPGGACIRLKKPVEAGTKLSIESRFERFAGVVRYCRNEGRDFVIGVQRDNSLIIAVPAPVVSPQPDEAARRLAEKASSVPVQESGPAQFSATASTVQRQTLSASAGSAAATPGHAGRAKDVRDWRRVSRRKPFPAADRAEMRVIGKSREKEFARGNKPMKCKWLDLAPWSNKQEDRRGEVQGEKIAEVGVVEKPSAKIEKENGMPSSTQPAEKIASREIPNFQVELLPMEDVFRVAGVTSPPRGYSVSTVIEMVNNEHIRDLSKEMKRAAVLMALDAAGVSIDQIQRDAKARQDALDAYEALQRKQAEAEWARKAEEITQIQAELETIKEHYTARINRCTEALSRDKARFNTWVTTKEQESRNMAEAVELCLKAPAAEAAAPPGAALAAAASAGSSGAKPQ
jgi:hypothetical protein